MRRSKKNIELFKTIDKLNDCVEEISYHAITRKNNRLDNIEKNAAELEKAAKSIQDQIKKMRRKT